MTAGARERILTTASDLFYERGFHAVGVDLIIERSGVAKTTLYRHFPSKDDLIVAYLADANTRFWTWLEDAIDPDDLPRDQLAAVFDAVAKLATRSTCLGCTFQVTAAEFPEAGHPGHFAALAHKQAVRERLHSLAAAAGAPEPTELADALMLLMDGAFAAARMYDRASPARHVAAAARILLDAHLPARRRPRAATGRGA